MYNEGRTGFSEVRRRTVVFMQPEDNINIFEVFGFYYDKMIDWETRLRNEGPFFKETVSARGVSRVLDVGCGTGRHAIMFAQWGLDVTAIDPSGEMIEKAGENAKIASAVVKLYQMGADGLGQLNQKFDMVTCLGNSLAHIREKEVLVATIQEFYDCLENNGILIIQMRNYDKVFLNRERYMPLNVYRDHREEVLFLRMTDLISDEQVQFNILVFQREKAGEWKFHVLSEPLTPWRRHDLLAVMAEVGFKNIETYGNYKKRAWSKEESNDLIIIAEKS
ncbi:class I SAM-dependent methyltransferase [Thermincola ferriacetica]|uniref:class I SAM-dependent methyltransferase n=1 Tax=Thermincola ferriacetica TaxID=281456 RepID=UPI00068F4AEE|nr:class I SAM-dependent methyltransferase [Thermincola ferriacetica]